MNRVAASVQRMQLQIAARLLEGLTTTERVEDARKSLDMDINEYVKFQEIKSLAFAMGILTDEEAQYVYRKLGCVPETFNAQDAATKSVLTNLFGELLRRLGSDGKKEG